MFKFRRKSSRTSNTTKYFRKRNNLKRRKPITPKKNPRKTKRIKPAAKKRILISSIILIILIGVFIYLTFLHQSFIVSQIEITETNDDNQIPTDIKQIIDKLKNQNLVTINFKPLEEKIKENHPEIQSLKFKKSFPSKIRLIISYSPPLTNFIINETPSGLPQKFIVNEEGKIFRNNEENPDLPTLILKNLNDDEFEKIIAEEMFFNSERIKKALQAKTLFENSFEIKITAIEYYMIEREAHLRTDKGFYIWIDLTKNIEEQINKLKRASGKIDMLKDNFIYIDLRINSQNGEKIIFKRAK